MISQKKVLQLELAQMKKKNEKSSHEINFNQGSEEIRKY
jgi:hypothetical protein